jgi:hypothetical protein
MMRLTQFIAEGGNVKIGSASSEPIKVTEHSRHQVKSDIHGAMSALHDSFHKEHGEHLFGKDKKALKTGSAYAGSTRHLFNDKISDKEFATHKKQMGDVDVQVSHDHASKLLHHLTPGKKLGKYTVVGTKKSAELHAIMKHENGSHHQVDFEGVDYHHHEPSHGDQFAHNSSWEDTKHGIKGMHHKQLLNAAGGTKHKFGPTKGLQSREDASDPGSKEPEHVTKRLFGKHADSSKVHSFHGVTDLIKKHIPAEQHQAIYDKFNDRKRLVGTPAEAKATLGHLQKHLSVKKHVVECITEAASTTRNGHHASVIPLVGFSPISHMGHAHDLGSALHKLPGKKTVGISSKADLYSPQERSHILKRQWHGVDAEHHFATSAGTTVAHAYHSLPKDGKKHLHLLVGHDRADMAKHLKSSLEAGKVKEMGEHRWDSISVHHPKAGRTHGMSGTNMRAAAASGDKAEFHKHLGPMFSAKEASGHLMKIHRALKSKTIALKR